MRVLPEVTAANDTDAASFAKGDLPMPPGREFAVLVCMDARIDPAKALGLQEGDAHVIRNASGRASDDALRSPIISYKLLGTGELLVIHHTDCGMLTFTSEQLQGMLKQDTGADTSSIDFLEFSDLEQRVRDDVAKIKASPLLPNEIPVSGFVYDVKSGRLHEVDRSQRWLRR